MLIKHRRKALPMLALALWPGPKAPYPDATGPQVSRRRTINDDQRCCAVGGRLELGEVKLG